MATTLTPIVSKGVTLKIKVGTSFVPVKGVIDVSDIGGGSPAVIDVSDLSSEAKEKLIGLPDEGQIKFNLNFIPDDTGQKAVETARAAAPNGVKTSWEVQLSEGTKFAFDGYPLAFSKSAGVDKQVTATLAIEVTGAITTSKAA